jgi:hypothetical protein
MLRVSRAAQLFVILLGTVLFFCRPALAEVPRPQSIYVLEIDSDDADDQAEALTAALRSRVRSAPEWLLLDATQSLSMLTAALRCPQHPDAACLSRIGDQLKADRFVWGVLSKQGAPPHFVGVEVHLWARGKPDVLVKESYSENVKDQNDDTLRKIATRVFDRLTGGPAITVQIHAGTADGEVVVDGDRTATLEHGSATLLLRSGSHAIDVKASGFLPLHQSIDVTGAESHQDVDVALQPVLAEAPASSPLPSEGRSPRRRAELGTLISGGILLAAGAALAIVFEAERSTLNTDRANNYNFENSIPTINNPCAVTGVNDSPQVSGGCTAHNVAQAVLIPEIASFGAGGILMTVGFVLLATDRPHETQPADTTAWDRLRITPTIGPHDGSLGLSGSF